MRHRVLVTLAVDVELPDGRTPPESWPASVAAGIAARSHAMRAFVPGRPLSKDPGEPFTVLAVSAISGVEVEE